MELTVDPVQREFLRVPAEGILFCFIPVFDPLRYRQPGQNSIVCGKVPGVFQYLGPLEQSFLKQPCRRRHFL